MGNFKAVKSASYVAQLVAAGYPAHDAELIMSLYLANAEVMAPMFGQAPEEYLASRLAGFEHKTLEEFERRGRVMVMGTEDFWQLDAAGNAVSPGETSPKIADVVDIDPSKIVDQDGRPIDLKNTRALAKWLRDQYQGMLVEIADDGTILEFKRRGLDASAKKRGEEQRQAYAGLDELVTNAVYDGFEETDKRHAGKVAGQNIYYSAANIDGRYFSVRIKVDMPVRSEGKPSYKDHKVSEIQIAPSLYRGRSQINGSTQDESTIRETNLPAPKSDVKSKVSEIEIAPTLYAGLPDKGASHQPADAIRGISLSVLKRDVNPSRIEDGILYQFSGERSVMSPEVQANLAEAMKLAESGTDFESVRQATGWFKGMDGRWRYEIPDRLPAINFSPFSGENKGSKQYLPKIYDHPELYKAYPFLEKVHVVDSELEQGTHGWASYRPQAHSWGEIHIDRKQGAASLTLVHEIQHLIQQREGFARGGSSANFSYKYLGGQENYNAMRKYQNLLWGNRRLGRKFAPILQRIEDYEDLLRLPNVTPKRKAYIREKLIEIKNKVEKNFPEEYIQPVLTARDKYLSTQDNIRIQTPFEQYQLLAGEIEARDVYRRSTLTDSERAAQAPDIRSDAIVIFGDAPVAAMSIDPTTERAAKVHAIQTMPAQEVKPGASLTKKEAEAVAKGFGKMENKRDGRVVELPVDTIGKILLHKGFDVSTILEDIPRLYEGAIRGWSEEETPREGHKPHPNIKEYHNYVGKFEQDGKEYYIRFTVTERTPPVGKTEGKNYIHSTAISDVTIYEIADSKARLRVIDPVVSSKSAFVDTKLQDFFNSVKREAEKRARYVNREKIERWQRDTGVYFPVATLTNASGNTLRTDADLVKLREGNPTLYQTAPPVESEAFKNWFGDSKVMDENGEPLVVYHGTTKDFEAFDPAFSKDKLYTGATENAHFFSDSADNAAGFAGRLTGDFSTSYKDGANVIPAFLALKKPLKANAKGENWQDIEYRGKFYTMPELVEMAQSKGYDGVIVKRVIDSADSGPHHTRSDIPQTTFVAFSPTQIKSVYNRGTFDPNDPRILYQGAYHGGPYRFDKFSLEHIGGGEGLQAYGWGLYFAGRKGIAESYRQATSRQRGVNAPESVSISGTVYDLNDPDFMRDFKPSNPEHQAVLSVYLSGGDIKRAIADLEMRVSKAARAEDRDAIREASKLFESVEVEYKKGEPGQLYKTDIPEDDVLLDWDASPSQEMLDKIAAQAEKEGYADYRIAYRDERTGELQVNGSGNGQVYYREISRVLGSDRAASEFLNRAGIRGLRYLDGVSRDSSEGSHNYVIFDDKAIQILRTYYQGMEAAEKDQTRQKFDASPCSAIPSNVIEGLPPLNKIGDLKTFLKQWAMAHGLFKDYQNRDTGWEIEFKPSGLVNVLGHGTQMDRVTAIAAIPQFLDNGILLESGKKNEQGLSSHVFAAKLDIGNEHFVAGFVVREDVNGKRYYDHELTEIENLDGLAESNRGADTRQSPTRQGSVLDIVRKHLGVKREVLTAAEKDQTRQKFDAVSSPEVSSEQVKAISSGDGFIQRVIDWIKPFFGDYVNKDTGMSGIQFDSRSVGTVINHWARDGKVALLEKVPDMIKNGVFLESTPQNNQGLISHVFASKATVDGAPYAVGFVVREDMNGKRYYDHSLTEIEALDSRQVLSSAPRAYPVRRESVSEIVRKHLGVKREVLTQEARGSIHFNPQAVITLFKKRHNPSTIIHESAHFFLNNLSEAARLSTAPDWVRQSWADLEREYNFSGKPPREAHERFAREFEAYVREGKAPAPRLEPVFTRFGKWLTGIYKSVKDVLRDKEEISPTVRAVFDRMLTMEQERHTMITKETAASVAENRQSSLWEDSNDRRTDSAARNSPPRVAAGNHRRSQKTWIRQLGLFDIGSVGAEQPGHTERGGSGDAPSGQAGRSSGFGSADAEQRRGLGHAPERDERLGDFGSARDRHRVEGHSSRSGSTGAVGGSPNHTQAGNNRRDTPVDGRLLDVWGNSGSVGGEQPGQTEGAGSRRRGGDHFPSGHAVDVRDQGDQQRRGHDDERTREEPFGDFGSVRDRHRLENGAASERDLGEALEERGGVFGSARNAGGRGGGYRISSDDRLGVGGIKTKYADNIAAIKLLRELQERRAPEAIPEEKKVLVRYVGWGGISNAFKAGNDKWAKEYRELQSLLSPNEFKQARRSTQDAHYTSETVVRGIWQGLARMGLKGSPHILEPSAGIGHFIGLSPEGLTPKFTAVELDPTSSAIAQYLYPQANHQNKGFHHTDFTPVFDAAIGNPPFGEQGVYDPHFPQLRSLSIHNFFLTKSIALLRDGGVSAFVVSRHFMDNVNPKVREAQLTSSEKKRRLIFIVLATVAFAVLIWVLSSYFLGRKSMPDSAKLTSVKTDSVKGQAGGVGSQEYNKKLEEHDDKKADAALVAGASHMPTPVGKKSVLGKKEEPAPPPVVAPPSARVTPPRAAPRQDNDELKRMIDDLASLETRLAASSGEGKIVYQYDFSRDRSPTEEAKQASAGESTENLSGLKPGDILYAVVDSRFN